MWDLTNMSSGGLLWVIISGFLLSEVEYEFYSVITELVWVYSVKSLLYYHCSHSIQRKLTDGMVYAHPRPFNVQPHRQHMFMGGAALIKCFKSSYTLMSSHAFEGVIWCMGRSPVIQVGYAKWKLCFFFHRYLFSWVVPFRLWILYLGKDLPKEAS